MTHRALAVVVSVLEAVDLAPMLDGMPADPRDPLLWSWLATKIGEDACQLVGPLEWMSRALRGSDTADVRSAAAALFDEANEVWSNHAVRASPNDDETGWGSAESRRQRDDPALASALQAVVPPVPPDALPVTRRGIEALRAELGRRFAAAASALDDLEGEMYADLGRVLLARALDLHGADDRRARRRIEMFWSLSMPLVYARIGGAPVAHRFAGMAAAAVTLLDQGWPPDAPVPSAADVPETAPGLAGGALLWPLVRRVHAPDWVSWRSDLPEARALLEAEDVDIPDVLLGIAQLVRRPADWGLPEAGRLNVLRALNGFVDRRLDGESTFVLEPADAIRLADQLDAEGPGPAWLRLAVGWATDRCPHLEARLRLRRWVTTS